MAFTQITITQDYTSADSTEPSGTVTFTPTTPMFNAGGVVPPVPVVARLDGGGVISITLVANTDPSTSPQGGTYQVAENINGVKRTYVIQVPHDQGSTLTLYSLAQLAAVPTPSFPPSIAQLPWIDVDSQSGGNDTAKMQAAITAAAARIAAGSGVVELRMSARRHTWTGATPTVPCNLVGRLRINGNGAQVTLTGSAPAFLEINKGADYDVFRNVDIFDVDIDANSIAGYGHAVIGTCTWSASSLTTHTRVGVDNVRVSRIKVTNLPTSWADADFRAGVYLMAGLTGASGESAVSVTNVVVEDVRIEGGRFGVAIGARFTTSGRVYCDNVHINRCWHDTGATPINFLGCTNFFLGARAYGGRGSVTNCHGKNSGDDGVEVNGLENALVDNCVIEDAANWGFLHNNFSPPGERSSQQIHFRDCQARVVNLVTSSAAGMGGKGYVLNTQTVSSTTTSSVSSGASTIPLTTVDFGSEVFFPTRGKVLAGGMTISYTGISGTSLTGVTGVTGTISSGATVTLLNDTGHASLTGCSFYKRGQTYWQLGGDGVKVNGPIRHLTIRDFSYTAVDWAAVISTPSTPAAFYINALPNESDTTVRLDNVRIRMTGARVSGSTADWIGFDMAGPNLFVHATGIEIDNAMTGMSAVNNVEGFRFGRISNGNVQAVIKGYKVRSLGDVGSVQKAIHTGTQTSNGNDCLFDFSGLDFTGLLSGAQDVTSDSGGYVRTRTFTESIITKAAGRAAIVTITPTTGSYQYQNIQQRRGVVVVSGGTVSQIQVGATNSALVTTGQTAGTFFLNPGDYIQVTNTVVPTMTFIPFQ
jgi:hypothetical protein